MEGQAKLGDMDHLSRLPDHLLVFILGKLDTKEAVSTSGLSRQWRRVWTHLPVLNFDGVDSSVPADALAAYQAHGGLDINSVTVCPNPNEVNAQQTAAWMSILAPILSGQLYLDNGRTVTPEAVGEFLNMAEAAVLRTGAIELPCFNRARELWLDLGFRGLALPTASVFYALRVMWLAHFWCRGHFNVRDAMLPSLQELTVRRVRGLVHLTLDSLSLMFTHLSALPELQQLDIVAPRLINLEVTHCFYEPVSVANIAAERLEVLRWEVSCVPEFGEMRYLCLIRAPPISTLWSESACAGFLGCFPAIDHLELHLSLGVSASSS